MDDYKTDTGQQPDSLDEDALRRRLVKRIAFAAFAIVALLGGLAVIDSMYVAPTTPAPSLPAPPVMADAAKQVQVPVATPPPPEPPQPQAIPTIKSSAEPEESASSSAPLPKPPRQPAKPAEVKPVANRPPASAPVTAPPASPAQTVQTERHFVLQMGVFNNVGNAQELLARLQNNGVPAQIEARVQVGPFKTKAEADEARAKLKAMGLNAGLLMAIHR